MKMKNNQKLGVIHHWLLPMLMSGQVQVGDVEEDDIGMAAEPVDEYKVRRK